MRQSTVIRRVAASWKALVVALSVGIAILCIVPFVAGDETAAQEAVQASSEAEPEKRERVSWEELNREFDERMAKASVEEAVYRNKLREDAPEASPVKHQKVKRFNWESPAESRGKVWNVPEEETMDALVTALLRVCIAEADGRPQDCVGIWQVVKNNRRRTCDRGMIRRITECHADGGETYLSALRRHQRHVLGYMEVRNSRARWVRNLETSCEMPEGWALGETRWNSLYGTKICPQAVADARRLLAGKLPESRPGGRSEWLEGRPVTWGGRCETKGGACDDRVACERALARIPDTNTLNAFWCRIGNSGCRQDPEPLCVKLGYRYHQVEYRGRMVWKLDNNVQYPSTTAPVELPTEVTQAQLESVDPES